MESAASYSFRGNPRYGKNYSVLVYHWLFAPRWPDPDGQTDFSPEECDAIRSFKQTYSLFVAGTLPNLRVEESNEIQQWQAVRSKARETLELLCRSPGTTRM